MWGALKFEIHRMEEDIAEIEDTISGQEPERSRYARRTDGSCEEAGANGSRQPVT